MFFPAPTIAKFEVQGIEFYAVYENGNQITEIGIADTGITIDNPVGMQLLDEGKWVSLQVLAEGAVLDDQHQRFVEEGANEYGYPRHSLRELGVERTR